MMNTLLVGLAVAQARAAIGATEEDGIARPTLRPRNFPDRGISIMKVCNRGKIDWDSLVLQCRLASTIHAPRDSEPLTEHIAASNLAESPRDETRAVEAATSRSLAVTSSPVVYKG
jgi:hypothetical protein